MMTTCCKMLAYNASRQSTSSGAANKLKNEETVAQLPNAIFKLCKY